MPQPSLSDIFTDECGDAPDSLDDYLMPPAFSNVEVVEVSSGNLIVVQLAVNKTRKTIRLAGLTAPDVKTNEGKAAQKCLSDLILGKRIFLFQYEETSADKMEGIIALAGTYADANLLMLKSGLVHYRESKFLSAYDNCVYKQTAEKAVILSKENQWWRKKHVGLHELNQKTKHWYRNETRQD